MTVKIAREKREQMLRDGYCIIPDILTGDFLEELRRETDRMNDSLPHHPDTKYQGTHIGVDFEDSPAYRKLGDWLPARRALEELGFGDFQHGDRLLILTKVPYGPALYLASGLGPVERSVEPHPLAANDLRVLLPGRHLD